MTYWTKADDIREYVHVSYHIEIEIDENIKPGAECQLHLLTIES